MLQRQSRYISLIALIIVVAVLHLTTTSSRTYKANTIPSDPTLASRLERSERTYRTVVQKRHDLVRKYGPSPSQIIMFPPDQDPWPAYTVWDYFPAAFNCPHELERIGNLGDGGKWTCGLSRIARKDHCIIYSFGMDWESSWEAAVLESTKHCQIWGYDHATRSFGRQVSHALFNSQQRTHFASRVQLGPINKHARSDEPKLYTLAHLMDANAHDYVDIVKIDVEGYEFDTLRSMVQSYVESGEPLPFGQLQVELHMWSVKFADFLALWELMEAAGLRPVMLEPNLVYVNYNRASGAELVEYTFLNIKGDNPFIKDDPSVGVLEEQPFGKG
ncbi:methyltransferase domain-containing protein [Irpex rosettiformis]|uniref:Methyltransferase domain-containing protein n=1 Tax=Irpex rosettiformis TaxID=378272 RepID=A0ACB8TTY3_9APHY|nr:methyltransferase domain-containing protein [Irpex rosettiformis]